MNTKLILRGKGVWDFIFSILGIVIMVSSIQLGFGSLGQPGPGLFPFFTGLMIFTAELVVIVSSIQKERNADSLLNKEAIRMLLALIVILCGWIVIMPYLGYILVTFATVFVFAKVLNQKGWLTPLILSAGTSLMVYILFERFLYLDLPLGFWG